MKTTSYSWVALILFTSLFNLVSAQSKDAEKYRKESEEMRKSVWAWDKPQFKVKDVPTRYANASKVILAHHTELTADSKKKLVFYGFTFGTKKEETISEVVRELVKLNDKTAVTEYSELSFTQFEKSSGFFSVDKLTSYVGVRVIKPNGTIKEIDADDIILTKDESSEKKAKLAIPDLQPGDILDYFIATDQTLTNDYSVKPYHVFLFDNAPVLSLSFHAQLGKKYAVDYRSYNGAPDISIGKNDDDEIAINVEKSEIPPFETSLWVLPGRQLPFIVMNISLGARGMMARAMGVSRKPGEINKLTDGDEAFKDKTGALNMEYHNNYWMKAARQQFNEIVDVAEKKAKQMGTRYRDLSDEGKALLLYYTFRYTKMMDFNIKNLSKTIEIGNYNFNNNAFILYCIMKAGNLDPAILLTGNRNGVRMSEAMDAGDISAVAFLQGPDKLLNLETVYDIPFIVPSHLEGLTETKRLGFSNKATHASNDVDPGPVLPVNGADKNVHLENLKLSLASDKTNIVVQRSTTLKGSYKVADQRKLILYEDLYESERKEFHDEKSLIEELEDHKKSRKDVDEVKNAFSEARKKQKDAFVGEAKAQFDQEVIELKNIRIDNLGVRHTAPDFIYSSDFNLGGLIKKAGNNIIVEIGKIQGEPFTIKPEQRKRDIDIYMPFARTIEFNIELQVPDGYTVEGISALNKKVENETGSFTAEASATDKMVNIKLKKQYAHNVEPAKNWDKLLQFMDAANDWENSKLLLKKK